jgi:hypothetical protein
VQVFPCWVQPLLQLHFVLPSSDDQLPSGHLRHITSCDERYWPAGQGTHDVGSSLASGETMPNGHGWHFAEPRAELNVLGGHFVQLFSPCWARPL